MSDRYDATILLVCDRHVAGDAIERSISAIAGELADLLVEVRASTDASDATSLLATDPSFEAVLVDWRLAGNNDGQAATQVITAARERNAKRPIFLLRERGSAAGLPLEIMSRIDEVIWLLEDTPRFIAGRIVAAAERYRSRLIPPMFGDLMRFNDVHEYSWHTPGHTGGTAFLKTAVGRAFFDYFGENLFRSDLSISVGELGSLLDHSGSIGASERYISGVFGSHRSYTVTNGSSTSNRIIYMASVTAGDIALCDRNCHKSVEQALTMTGAIPAYLLPERNYLGIIGPIRPERLEPAAITKLIADTPLAAGAVGRRARHATVTNSTYDGICYSARRLVELLSPSVDRLHFDEAWYGYARFHPLYKDRYGMYGAAADYPVDAPTVFTTQSTHKLLAALSQASYIHVRDGRSSVSHDRFNEAFMMHASTSPLYSIIASNEVSAAMMDEAGPQLMREAIGEAIDFRQMVGRFRREEAAKGSWFFSTWNADRVTAADGRVVDFDTADPAWLAEDPGCWVLHPNEDWHGYGKIEDGYALLDPIKVSVVSPGVDRDGTMADNGIPAAVLVAYLDAKGIVNEKSTDFTVLFLFSIGVTRGKWGTLLNALLEFKRDYDANAPLADVLPAVLTGAPERYAGMGLKDLSDAMFRQMKATGQTALQSRAYARLPVADMHPQRAYQHLVHDEVEQVPLSGLANRTLATGIVPYPPGIPLLMPGENAGAADGPVIGYLEALQAFDRLFPGFTHDTHGVEVVGGDYRVYVLKAGVAEK
jgi:lysine decarboxylase/arginine decarboxylase